MKKINNFELKFENLEKLYDELIYSNMKKERFAENYIKLMMLRNLMVENLK